jgi:hypothetical protein
MIPSRSLSPNSEIWAGKSGGNKSSGSMTLDPWVVGSSVIYSIAPVAESRHTVSKELPTRCKPKR